VSQAVSRLEESLQVGLFVRAVRRISLTPAGASLFAAADRALRDIERALAAIAPKSSALVRLTAPPTWVALWLMPRLAGFAQAAPTIQVQVDASSQLQDIEADGIDIGIRYARSLPPHFKRVALFDQVFVPVCHAGIAAQLHGLADLREQRLLHESDLSRWTAWLAAAAADAGQEPPAWDGAAGLYFSQGTLAVSAASRGLGVALTEPAFIGGAGAGPGLVQPFAFRWKTGFSYHAVWSSRSPLSPAARQFLDWLKAEAEAARSA
jgi:LysR family glycine cleavage system transcriptional activator